MYSKEEAKELKKDFWEGLTERMAERRSASGKKVNWLSYKTGVKDMYIRMEADRQGTRICIDFQHRDAGIRELFWEQFEELKVLFEDAIPDTVSWYRQYTHSNGLEISRVSLEQQQLSMFRVNQWPDIYDFLERNLVALDEFWVDFSDVIKNLQ